MLQSEVLEISGTNKRLFSFSNSLRHAGVLTARGRYNQFCAERLRLFDYLLFTSLATSSDHLQKTVTVYTTDTLYQVM